MSYISRGAKQAQAAREFEQQRRQRQVKFLERCEVSRIGWEGENRAHRDAIEYLLTKECVPDTTKEVLKDWLAWLSERPTNTLSKKRYMLLVSFRKTIHRHEACPFRDVGGLLRLTPRARRKRERPKLPPWLQGDSSCLPKRPPGKR